VPNLLTESAGAGSQNVVDLLNANAAKDATEFDYLLFSYIF
jgi:hypothetical protein